MTAREFQKLCRSGAPVGAFLFCGEEEYLKNRCLHLARAALFGDEEDDPFNRVVIACENIKDVGFLDDLAEQISALPMFGDRRLIELHGVNYHKLSGGDLDTLLSLLREQRSSEDSLLILYAESGEFDPGSLPNKPTELYKAFVQAVNVVTFDYETPAALNAWVVRHFSASGLNCSPGTAYKIITFCSKDMFVLAGEIEKLTCYTLAAGKKEVDEADIERVCCGKSIDGAFAFTDAMMRGDSAAATRLLHHMINDRQKPENILGGVLDTLSNMYAVKLLRDEGLSLGEIRAKTGLHEFRVKNFDAAVRNKKASRLESALRLLMEADLQIKSTGLDDYAVLEKLVIRLCRV